MIRVNLLENPIEVIGTQSVVKVAFPTKKVTLYSLVALILALASYFGVAFLNSTPSEAAPEIALAEPTPPEKSKDQAIAGVVEDPVKEVGQEVEQAPVVKDAPKKESPKASESLIAQRKFMSSTIEKLYDASPVGIGFSDVVVRYPEFFYVKGIADDRDLFQTLKSKIETGSADFKMEALKPIGVTQKAQEFTIYGRLKVVSQVGSSELIAAKDVENHLDKIKEMAKSSGLEQFELSGSDGQGRQVLRGNALASTYPKLKNFLQLLKDSSLPVGLQQISLKATEKEAVSIRFEFVIYTK